MDYFLHTSYSPTPHPTPTSYAATVQSFEYELFLGFIKMLFVYTAVYMFIRDIFVYAIPWAVSLIVKWVETSVGKVVSVAEEFAKDAEVEAETEMAKAAAYAEGMVTRSVAAARASLESTTSADSATDAKKME